MRRLAVMVMCFALGASVLVGTAASGGGKHKRKLSAFGEYAVRFQPGTSLQDMTKVVKKAGGTVIEDMHQISALEVASADKNFLTKLQGNPLVLAAFVDGVGPSANSQLGGPGGQTTQQAVSDGFDPWHGQFQW